MEVLPSPSRTISVEENHGSGDDGYLSDGLVHSCSRSHERKKGERQQSAVSDFLFSTLFSKPFSFYHQHSLRRIAWLKINLPFVFLCSLFVPIGDAWLDSCQVLQLGPVSGALCFPFFLLGQTIYVESIGHMRAA